MAHLVIARIGLGQMDAAWKMLADLAREFPDSTSLPPARLRLAEAALLAHQNERAAEQFRLVTGAAKVEQTAVKGSDHKPSDAVTKALRGASLQGAGTGSDRARQACRRGGGVSCGDRACADDASAPEVALAEAHALEDGKLTDQALKAYSLIQEHYENSTHAARARLRALDCSPRREGPATRAANSSALIGDGHARDSLEKAGVKPDELLAEWGWSLVDADKAADADRVFGRLLKEHPDSPFAADARFNLAESANLRQGLCRSRPAIDSAGDGQDRQPRTPRVTAQSGAQANAGPERARRFIPASASRRALSTRADPGGIEGLDRRHRHARPVAH